MKSSALTIVVLFSFATIDSLYCFETQTTSFSFVDSHNDIASGIRSYKSERFLLQQEISSEEDGICNGICSYSSELKLNTLPFIHDGSPMKTYYYGKNRKWTCEQWDNYLRNNISNIDETCLIYRDGLKRQCCKNLRPAYECQTLIEDKVLSSESKYSSDRIPLTDNDVLNVSVLVDVTNIEITNHGVDGGAINVEGSIMLQWVDERLKWDYTVTGDDNNTKANDKLCATTSIRINSNDIWTPDLEYPVFDGSGDDAEVMKYLQPKSKATVLADGRVFWVRRHIMTAACHTILNGAGKHCSILFQDHKLEGSFVKYRVYDIEYMDNSTARGGIVIRNNTRALLQDYNINTADSVISFESRSDSSIASSIHNVIINIVFVARKKSCNICGHGTASLVNGTRLKLWDRTINKFKGLSINTSSTCHAGLMNSSSLNCYDLNKCLESRSASDKVCLPARSILEEFCCEDPDPQYDCEKNVHDIITNKIGDSTVTPPDPPPKAPDADTIILNDFVNVRVALDVHHVSGINVKENSIEILVSLELTWYDERLSWSPFLGGCHRASFYASLDAESTEIWVPNIRLVNKLEGLEDLQEARASVKFDGRVKWRRTGVVKANCDLTGLIYFPYDTPGCYLEFGGTRNPMYERVYYEAKQEIDYSEHLTDDKWNFQEYRIVTKLTNISTRIEKLSGYENEVIRFQFYFQRAGGYYTFMFVILYILFTYLSFGMFFVDYSVGERLGYGSAVLFTIVAQDITMAESTPVTNELLWIYKLSFASKIFVIVALVYSICVLWLYTRNNFDGQTLDEEPSTSNRNAIDLSESNSLVNIASEGSKFGDRHCVDRQQDNSNFIALDVNGSDCNGDSMDSNITGVNQDDETHTCCSKNNSRSNGRRTINKSAICSANNLLESTIRTTGNKLVGYDMKSDNDSQRVKLIKRLRTYDVIMFLICFISYTITILWFYLKVPEEHG